MKKYILSLVLSTLVLSGCGVKTVEINLQTTDAEPVEEILDLGTAYKIEETPFGVLLPHDSIAKMEVAAFYEALEQIMKPKTIVVLGENNPEISEFNIRTCLGCLYKTDFGNLSVDTDLAEKLNKTKWARAADENFISDKIISFHAPYIKNHFPNSEVLAIALNEATSVADIDLLAVWLNENLPPDSLVIGSSNFAEYVSAEIAGLHDASAYNSINNFSYSDIYLQNLGSPPVVYALMKLMDLRGMKKVIEVDHTNSEYITRDHLDETTGYEFITFSEGKSTYMAGVSIMSFGNLTPQFDLSFGRGWQFNKDYNPSTDLTDQKLMRDIRRREDKFLVGTDFLVFDLIDNACSTEEKNTIKILFCKFDEDSELEKNDMYEIIKNQNTDIDLVYLLYDFHFNSEGVTGTAKAFADNGVDIFIGRGLKDVEPFSIYNGSLLFYSLGDFVTENRLVSEISNTSSGVVIGLYITPTSFKIYPLPLSITNGYPKLLDYYERGKFYLDFRENAGLPSGAEIDVQNGSITVKR